MQVLATAKRCSGTGIGHARTSRTACARMCEQSAECVYMESDGTICVIFAAEAKCELTENQVRGAARISESDITSSRASAVDLIYPPAMGW